MTWRECSEPCEQLAPACGGEPGRKVECWGCVGVLVRHYIETFGRPDGSVARRCSSCVYWRRASGAPVPWMSADEDWGQCSQLGGEVRAFSMWEGQRGYEVAPASEYYTHGRFQCPQHRTAPERFERGRAAKREQARKESE